LDWQEDGQEKWLAVAACMKYSDYDNYYKKLHEEGGEGTVASGVNIWVTLIPQIRDFCRSLGYPDKSYRIKQFLGLDPNRSYEVFVDMWVKPEDLFRHCPDPEIEDPVCKLNFDYKNPEKVKNIDNYAEYY
jgi:hypothetical protein